MSTDQYTQIKENWGKVLENLSPKISAPIYDGCVKPAYPISIDNNTLVIAVPSTFAKDYLESRYKTQFFDALKDSVDELSGGIEINFIVKEIIPVKTEPEIAEKEEIKAVNPAERSPVQITNPNNNGNNNNNNGNILSGNLNPNYNFESYVVGNNNHFSSAAAQRVAESPGKAYNPLFIYGGVGLGKTHLMHSIGNQMLKKSKDVKIVYVSSEKFTNELINSIKDYKMIEFKNKYRNIDLLLIDDIQFIEGKERAQEEFFHTFNALYEEGKQIVLSSDRPPKEISSLEERLRSRFEMGLLADVQPPDFETRVAILKKKSEHEQFDVTDDVLHYIASAFKDNVRELEGAFIRVMAYASLTNIPVTVSLARTILGREKAKEITLETIKLAVAEFYQLQEEDLNGNYKTKEITWARHVAMYISRDRTKNSLQKISESFGRKDHTTVLHAFEKVKNAIQSNPEMNNEIKKIIEKIEE